MSRIQRPAGVTLEIGHRLIALLTDDLGMTIAEASRRMAYSTPSTLQSVKAGRNLPDAARLGAFAMHYAKETGREINLHWLLTGRGDRFLASGLATTSGSRLDVDIINTTLCLDEPSKRALLVLLSNRSSSKAA